MYSVSHTFVFMSMLHNSNMCICACTAPVKVKSQIEALETQNVSFPLCFILNPYQISFHKGGVLGFGRLPGLFL
jgi:hypothetical protein